MPVTKLDITSVTPFAGGQTFGEVGAYNHLKGTAHFSVDPLHPNNTAITDIELAPRDSEGRVHFSADFEMLQPADPERGRGSMIFDVVNRGRKTILGFNSSPRAMDPGAPLHPGNGFLMREGYTVVFCGWQSDVPADDPDRISLYAPQALNPDGSGLTGRMLCQFQCNEPTNVFLLADRIHDPHPPTDPHEPGATLTVRDHPNGPATDIARDQFQFVRVEDEQVEPDLNHVYLRNGFEPGRIYQLVYTTTGTDVVGVGMASVRDIVSFLKYESEADGNPCAGTIDYAHAFGASQSGRFLRTYIYYGLNNDEKGRIALDGIIPHIAGGMRGEFNLRFGQPSKDVCYIIPELFPFSDAEITDPVTGASGSITARLDESGNVPKIMFTNTSAEYWRGDAALIHTDFSAMTDAPESENVRRYHFAGTQHGTGTFPPETIRQMDALKGQLPYNAVDYSPLQRAQLNNLDSWVRGDDPAPASRHPSLDDGTGVESHTLRDKFERIPSVAFPPEVTRAMRLDYGDETHLGRTVKLPAEQGEEYPAIVSNVDDDGNEVGGIRLPSVSVPLATNTGWNLRHPDNGNPGLVIGITGGLAGWTLPFHKSKEDREATGDPRPAIEERYESRDDYVEQVRQAASDLASEGYILEEDIEREAELAAHRYDYWMNGNGTA